MPSDTGPESACLELLEQSGLTSLIQAAKYDEWQQVAEKTEALVSHHIFPDPAAKNIFLDLLLSHCLASSFLRPSSSWFWLILEKWFHHRNPFHCSVPSSSDERAAAVFVTLRLREQLSDWLLAVDYDTLRQLGENYHNLMLSLWRQVFLDMAVPHNMFWDTAKLPSRQIEKDRFLHNGFTGLLAASMYYPLGAGDFTVDCDALLDAPLPLHCRNILICWLINIPYFNGTMQHRDRLTCYVPKLCEALLRRPGLLGAAYFVSLVQEIMTSFWRASYIGGNNLEALSAFGDLIHVTINRLCPNLSPPIIRKPISGRRIRLGYISRNIFRQAVPYYMVNRIIHHDRDKFEVFVFALAEREDDFTKVFIDNCDHFQKFTDLKNFGAIINSVLASQLDILIFTDIGMDAVTYILGGLRLAPIQCAMVGHGTTTGLPTIDYYLSGDFEAPAAQAQYREKLIRLPVLGAAQYLPDPPLRTMTREDLGIPADAVLFISCANGIKHRSEREPLYLEILRQAPNAWVLIKPYTTPGNTDAKLTKRLREAAQAAGVNDRLIILPSIGHYRGVLGLLEIADVQLDTYPYGGWTTNLEALFVGLPIVTQEGELSRSRWGAGMLRALGVEAGIAANEAAFVREAVRFAQDRRLREQVACQIRAKAVEVLFNGPAAQPAFEKALTEIFYGNRPEQRPVTNKLAPQTAPNKPDCLRQLGPVSFVIPRRVYVATSLSPRDYPGQRTALATWQQAGFRILALNPPAELDALRCEFPSVELLPAPRDAKERYKKPYVYFDDVLTALGSKNATVSGIINSDIHLLNPALFDFIAGEKAASVVFGSRFDAVSLTAREGKLYHLGFDYFFFHRDTLAAFPREAFCLGLPWWDFWAALVPLQAKIPVKRLVTPITLHVSHPTSWDKDAWLSLGNTTAAHFPAPFPLSADSMLNYLHYLAQKINLESRDIML